MDNSQLHFHQNEPLKEAACPDQSLNVSSQITELIFERAARQNLSKYLKNVAKPLMARESIITMKLTYDSVQKDTSRNVLDTAQDEPDAPTEIFIKTLERKPKLAN